MIDVIVSIKFLLLTWTLTSRTEQYVLGGKCRRQIESTLLDGIGDAMDGGRIFPLMTDS